MFAAVTMLASCDKGDDNKNVEITSGQASRTVWADDKVGGGEVTFKTTGAWTSMITEDVTTRATAPDWISITPTSGSVAGAYSVDIILVENYTGTDRHATIVITCNGDKIDIAVTQKGVTESGKVPHKSVTIGGVKWATANIAEPDGFASKPEDSGDYYTFEEAQTVCPEGWRTPTVEEFESLVAAGSEWTTVNGSNGRRFGSGDNTIFLPAAGNRNPSPNSTIFFEGVYGYYQASNTRDADSYGFMIFGELAVDPGYHVGSDVGLSVRCVAK